MRILIFPGGMPRGLECLAANPGSIGASSVPDDPARIHYHTWLTLPFVTEETFAPRLEAAIAEHKIEALFCPHPVAWEYISAWAKQHPATVLLGTPPTVAEQAGFRQALQASEHLDTPLTQIEMAALLRQTWRIEGEMHDAKLVAFSRVFPSLPAGDIVEIGSLYGRSAYVLAWLARKYQSGMVLCIDPWETALQRQHDVGATKSLADARDFALIRKGFLINLLGLPNLNYLVSASAEAMDAYRTKEVKSEFGTTRYSGHIAFLHIDGNHDYAFARDDLALWAPLVQQGGWIVMDDYEWRFGDGPRRAGDEFLHAGRVREHFIAGGALFMRV